MFFYPNSFGSALREFNSCHDPETGQFCAGKSSGSSAGHPSLQPERRVERLKKLLPYTTTPGQTAFLLPDGTRLSKGRDSVFGHDMVLGKYGYNLDGVLGLGVVRYVPHVGVEIGKPLTDIQAKTLADDWAGYGESLVVDAVNTRSGESREVISTKEFFEPSSDVLYQWSRRAYQ